MRRPRIGDKPFSNSRFCLFAAFFSSFVFLIVIVARAQNPGGSPTETPAAQSNNISSRGQKLVLKDGSFQLVREYEVNGDRIRYYSLDTHEWEEMPASLVDWDATKKRSEEHTSELQSPV